MLIISLGKVRGKKTNTPGKENTPLDRSGCNSLSELMLSAKC